VHVVAVDKSAIDVICVYCPDTDECYYVRPASLGASVTLRVAPSRNGQAAGVLQASDYRRLSPVACGDPDGGHLLVGSAVNVSARTLNTDKLA
jgi:hypothetical protein